MDWAGRREPGPGMLNGAKSEVEQDFCLRMSAILRIFVFWENRAPILHREWIEVHKLLSDT
jgi:hypothetical protein